MKPIIAAALAAALALTALPAPADPLQRRINPEAAAAVLFGLATLAIVAQQAQRARDNDDDDDAPRTVTRRAAPELHRSPPPKARHAHRPRHLSVPVDCARRVEMWGKRRTAFGTPCLRRNQVDVARLPRECAADIRVGQRKVVAWGATCLHRAGVRIE